MVKVKSEIFLIRALPKVIFIKTGVFLPFIKQGNYNLLQKTIRLRQGKEIKSHVHSK